MPDPVTGIMAAASIGSGVANIFGAQSAADAQKAAADKAAQATLAQQQKGFDTQKQYFDQGAKELQPLADQGNQVYKDLVGKLPDLTAPINMDQATLEKTPGYKFNLDQGIRGIDLSAVSRGMSGAQAKAAAQFATGLADNTYQNQFNNANINKTNAFNRLLGTATVGTDASKYLANNATSAGNAALGNTQAVGKDLGGYAVGAGNAQGAANLATGQQFGNMINGVSGAYYSNNLLGNSGGSNWGANNPGAAGSSYYGPVAPGMYGK
jgi:hypothetical protein